MTPYVVPFTQAFDVVHQLETYGRRYDALGMVCGSQMGKTDALLDVVGWGLDQRPAPMMYVGPNKDFLLREIEPRLMAVLNGAPRIRDRLATGKRMTRFRKVVGGVPLALSWAGSAASLRAMAAKTVVVDELDSMASSIQGEGDPFTLAEARGFSFRDRIRAAISTPLIGSVDVERCDVTGLEFWKPMDAEDVASPIWRLFQSGTRCHWCWPCPHCDEYFVPRFRQLRWPEGAMPAEARRGAYVECPRCGGVIEENHKRDMNDRGRYVAPGQVISTDGVVSGHLIETTMLTFWVSGLASPFVTFGERAASYVAAKLTGEQDKIQAVVNTGFGECYMPGGGDVPEWQEVAALKRPYKSGALPDGARVLTLTADVQKTRILYVIRAWGHKATSWLVEYGELHGPTTHSEVWAQLAEVLTTPIGDMVIRRALIDSGYRPGKPYQLPVNRVYEFCRRFQRVAYPSKGKDRADKPVVITRHEINQRGDAHKYGLDLVWIDTDHTKSWVHERLRWPSESPGAWYLPEDISDDYCKQIVSEARVRNPSGKPQWVARSRENHYLDCEAMQAALAHWMRFDLIRGEPMHDEAPPRSPAAVTGGEKRQRQQTVAAAGRPSPGAMAADRRSRIAELGARMRAH